METKNEKLYSMPRDKIVSYVKEGKEQLSILHHLVADQLEKSVKHKWLISNLCDSYSTNYKLVSELSTMIELSSDKEKNEVLMTRDDIHIIESILIARHYTNREIERHGATSISVH